MSRGRKGAKSAREQLVLGAVNKRAAFAETALQALAVPACMPTGDERAGKELRRMATGRSAAKKVSCDDCYFRCNLLCALDLDEPCATFRPDHPDGLRPPRQLRFHFRQERRTQAAWAFPTAQEQAALHR
jgi:hypothetical protein